MEHISAIIASVITAILTIIGTQYQQKRKNNIACRKNALYLYLNIKQIRTDIDRDKKAIDGNQPFLWTPYFNPFDYTAVLCALNDKLTEQEISKIFNFYENIKKLDNSKTSYSNVYYNYYNYSTMNPGAINPYQVQHNISFNNFKNNLNNITNSDEYKIDIVEIMSKLRNIKG